MRYLRGLKPRGPEPPRPQARPLLKPVRVPGVVACTNDTGNDSGLASVADRTAYFRQLATPRSVSGQTASPTRTPREVDGEADESGSTLEVHFDWQAMSRFQDTLRGIPQLGAAVANKRKRPHYDNRQRAQNKQSSRKTDVFPDASSIVCLLGFALEGHDW